MNRKAILSLSFLLEQDQLEVLDSFGILHHKPYGEGNVITCTHPESLSECAERLWRKANNKYYQKLLQAMYLVLDNSGALSSFEGFWMCDALPIHRIQAALLAKEIKE